MKNKGEKERYKHLNAEFQRIARRDKKAFLGDQSKEIEENNRMGKTRRSEERRVGKEFPAFPSHLKRIRDKDHPQDKEMHKSKIAVWGGLTNS